MKILVLMPLDEKYTYLATALYNALPHEIKDKTFNMPMFMQWAITTKMSQNWTQALVWSLASAGFSVQAAAAKQDDILVIGNCDKEYEFDAVFNMQDINESMPYKDLFLEKVIEQISANQYNQTPEEQETVLKYLSNLYIDKDSKMSLRNISASADFLALYMRTGVNLEEIKQNYKDKLEFKNEPKNRECNTDN